MDIDSPLAVLAKVLGRANAQYAIATLRDAGFVIVEAATLAQLTQTCQELIDRRAAAAPSAPGEPRTQGMASTYSATPDSVKAFYEACLVNQPHSDEDGSKKLLPE